MKEFLLFHYKIFDILKTFSNSNDDIIFILLSLDNESIVWLITVEDLDSQFQLTQDFKKLLKFLIPRGVKIIGVLILSSFNNENDPTKNLDDKISCIYGELSKDNLHLLDRDKFYSFVINRMNLKSRQSDVLNMVKCTGKIYKFSKLQNDLMFFEYVNNIKFQDNFSQIKEKYICIKTFVNPLVVINKQYFLFNESFSKYVGIHIPEFFVTVPHLKEESIPNMKIIESKFDKMLSDYDEFFLDCDLLISTKIDENTYFEETNNLFYSIHQEKKEEQKIKSIKISSLVVMEKKKIKLIDLAQSIIENYKMIFNEIYNYNIQKTETYSLYNFYNPEISPIPLGVLYSYIENYDPRDDSTKTQRLLFHKMLNIQFLNHPVLRKYQLENNDSNNNIIMEKATNMIVRLLMDVHKLDLEKNKNHNSKKISNNN
jgi:hypothetical protein